MTRRPAMAGLLCLAGLGACARRPPPPPPPPPAPPAVVESGLDGLYRGTSTRYRADARACPGPGLVTLRVMDGVFDYRWSSKVTLQGRIADDRTVGLTDPGGPLGDIALSGRAAPGVIEGDVTSPSCAFHFTVRKRG